MHRWYLLGLAFAFVAAACSSDGSDDTSPPDTLTTTSIVATTTTASPDTTTTTEVDDGFPVTIDAPNGPVTIEERPERIVSISPTSTEVLFAVGAGDRVVAVDSLSNHPPEAPVTDLSAFTPSIEAIAAFEPDLVFLSFDPNQDVIPGLEALEIPVILHGTAFDLDDAYAQWEQVGAATGHLPEAVQLVADTQVTLDDLYEAVPAGAADLSYYYELDDTYFSLTSASFVGELLTPTGMANIADTEDADGFGFPQLTSEYIVGSDPDLILLADVICCGQTAETVAERPGWDSMTAVIQGQIVELDDDIASRWGPRIVDLVGDVVEAILLVESVGA